MFYTNCLVSLAASCTPSHSSRTDRWQANLFFFFSHLHSRTLLILFSTGTPHVFPLTQSGDRICSCTELSFRFLFEIFTYRRYFLIGLALLTNFKDAVNSTNLMFLVFFQMWHITLIHCPSVFFCMLMLNFLNVSFFQMWTDSSCVFCF